MTFILSNVYFMKFKEILGIDVGGSGIKGAPVNIKEGILLADRFRIPTPEKANPENVSDVIKEIIDYFEWEGPVGVGFPSVVQSGIVKTASNIDKSWIGTNAQSLLLSKLQLPTFVVNDADAAGLAEVTYGAGKKVKGTVLMITVGTGIGSALFVDGHMVPNTEFGHIYLKNGSLAENYAADSARERLDLDWTEWGTRFNTYLKEIEKLFSPDLIIIGGGVSKRFDKYMHTIDIGSKLVIAEQRNEAGILGAAMSAAANKKALKKEWENWIKG